MKTSFTGVACTLALGLLMTACTIDAYDKGEGEYSLLTAEMADFIVGHDKYVTDVLTDNNEHLSLDKPYAANWMEKADTTYRALFWFNRRNDGKAETVSMTRVGVLTPHQLRLEDGESVAVMKTDPLYVESLWTGKNRKYVNMRLRLLTGASEDDKAIQTLGIIRDTINSSETHEHLVLYHDQGRQPEYYSTTAYVSIPLAAVPADTLTITVNTYDGTFTRTIVKTKE